MPPMLLQMLPFIAKSVSGLFQTGKGLSNLFGSKRPEYEIPTAQNQATALAGLRASSDMGGYNQAKSDIGTSTGNALTAARESGNPMALIGQIQGNENNAVNKLNIQNSEYRNQQQQNYQNALSQQAQYQDKAWQINKFSPYMDKQQEGRQMVGAGLSNVFGAMSDANNFKMYQDLLKGVNNTSGINASLSGGQGGGGMNNGGGIGMGNQFLNLMNGGNSNINNILRLMAKQNQNPLSKLRMLGE